MGKGSKFCMDRLLSTSASTGHLTSPTIDLPDLDEADVWSINQPDVEKPIMTSRHHQEPPPINHTHRCRDPNIAAASSAPVSMPDWTGNGGKSTGLWRESELKEEDGEQWVPPHLWAQGRNGGSTSSVFEGVGRTLKGRDMSRVRDAVWNRTGFFG